MIYSQDFFSCQFLSSSFAYCDNGVKRNCISVHEFNMKLTVCVLFLQAFEDMFVGREHQRRNSG